MDIVLLLLWLYKSNLVVISHMMISDHQATNAERANLKMALVC